MKVTATRSNTPPNNPLTGSSPFKGEAGTGWPRARGMGFACSPQSEPMAQGHLVPIALGYLALALPLKGRELAFTAVGFRRDD